MTVTQVMGCGIQKGAGEYYRGVEMDATLMPKIKVEVIVSKIPVEHVIKAVKKALYTGHIGGRQDLRIRRREGREGPHRRDRLRCPSGRAEIIP